jgi:hypothetical protein
MADRLLQTAGNADFLICFKVAQQLTGLYPVDNPRIVDDDKTGRRIRHFQYLG